MITETVTWTELIWTAFEAIAFLYALRATWRYLRAWRNPPELPRGATPEQRFRLQEEQRRVGEKLLRSALGLSGFTFGLPLGVWSMTMPNVLVVNPLILGLIWFGVSYSVVIVLDEINLDRRIHRIEEFERNNPQEA